MIPAMGILDVTEMDFDALSAALAWQVELGVVEAIGDAPVNWYEVPDEAPTLAALAQPKVAQRAAPKKGGAASARPVLPEPEAAPDPETVGQAALVGVADLAGLRDALSAFEGCELKRGARNTVFADGTAGARVMVIGEPPDREEDSVGTPFVGRSGQLLDRMFEAIGMARSAPDQRNSVYLTSVLPWRPPQNRDPEPAELAMMLPFLRRHIELAKPDVLVLMGNVSCQALLGRKGVTRLRGTWAEVLGLPALPMFHPGYLRRNPLAKRDAWADLLSLQARLRMADEAAK